VTENVYGSALKQLGVTSTYHYTQVTILQWCKKHRYKFPVSFYLFCW